MRSASLIFLHIALASFACNMGAQPSKTPSKPTPPPRYRIAEDNLFGFIDSTGTVRIQPKFVSAQHFSEGLAAVRENGRYGYIDLKGQYALPPKYDYATAFEEGEALVWIEGKCFKVNRKGSEKAFNPEQQKRKRYDSNIWEQSEKLEKKAKSLGFEDITTVYKNRRFARGERHKWFLTDASGALLNPTPFDEVLYVENPPFDWDLIWENGMAIVKAGNQIGAVDMDGKYTIPLRAFDFNVSHFNRWGNQLVLFTKVAQDNGNGYRYGIWNMAENTLIVPKFEMLDASALQHGGLIAVVENHRAGYITPEGKYVWQEKEPLDTFPQRLNIDHMFRGFFYAASPSKEEYNGYGGWGGSDNYAHKITNHEAFEAGKIQLLALPAQTQVFQKNYQGFRVLLANTSPDTLVLDAQDSHIYLYLQALDPRDSTWRDIMYQPSSWCGNSYHQVFLAPGEYWDFTAPVIEGEIRTQLRLRLVQSKKGSTEIISNTFEGGINPAQFWRKNDYYPAGIMDPYDD